MGFVARSVSVVVPVFDEQENVRPLVVGIAEAMRPQGIPFEIVLVDDGSRDGTLRVLRELIPEVPELVVVALRRNSGQTLALQAGLDRARGDAVVTMDGDLQNDPRDIPKLLQALADGADVASGWRRDRQDTLLLRKVPSWIANRLIRLVTGVRIHDQGCSLKAYRGDVVRELDLYGDMHRFIAILTMPVGASIAEVPVRHHARVAGASKYGISRTFKVLADLFTIQMLTWFRESPLRWFALLGIPFSLAAFAMIGLWLAMGGRGVVLGSVGLISAMTFGSCLLVGLLGESATALGDRGRGRRVVAHEWERGS
jgi:glycosyltransferase involved in cell wall biosynthesis